MSLASLRTQYFPPAPAFTDKDVGENTQVGRVFIVTGGNQGVGFELIKMIYPTGATIYMASRSKERAEVAIQEIISSNQSNASCLKFLYLDLNDLTTVRSAAKTFLDQETRLDILWNNAGIGAVPVGSKTKQGIEAHMGVNVIGPLLLTQLVHPAMQRAASSAPKNSVRIIWTGSWMMEGNAPSGGFNLKDLDNGGVNNARVNYAVSKASNWMLSNEVGKRYGKDGIISVCQNPGNLDTRIYDTQPRLMMFFVRMGLHPPKMGAYTELFAGFSNKITQESQGAYIIPWGRIQEVNPRKDIYLAIEQGQGKVLWEWCDAQIKAHS